MGGRRYAPQPVRYAYMPDPTLESARTVVVKLHHRVGRYVKLQLHFRTRWILLSEVSFDSGEFVLEQFTIGGQLKSTLFILDYTIYTRIYFMDCIISWLLFYIRYVFLDDNCTTHQLQFALYIIKQVWQILIKNTDSKKETSKKSCKFPKFLVFI